MEVDGLEVDPAVTISIPSPYEFRSIRGNGAKVLSQDVRFDSRGTDEAFCKSMDSARRTGFEEGRREGEHAARIAAEAVSATALAQERAHIASVVRNFRDSRNQYFSAMEREVVRLALAIAARVLHREAQFDPLLLAGVARVALDKLADRSGVTLRVPAGQIAGWQKVFESMEIADRPIITGDPSLAAAECILETNMGSVEIGIAAQLDEIERGFFDLLNHRPTS